MLYLAQHVAGALEDADFRFQTMLGLKYELVHRRA